MIRTGIVAASAAVLAACFGTSEGGPAGPLPPSCDIAGPTFAIAPFDLTDIDRFEPMGAVAPPLHVLPGDYVTALIRLEDDVPVAMDVVAPGDVDVALVVRRTHYNEVDEPAGEDYSVAFDACREVRLSIDRLTELAPALVQAAGAWDQCFDNGRRNGPGVFVHFTFCVEEVGVAVEAGALLGRVGGARGKDALELRAWDARNRPHAFANPFRYGTNGRGFDIFHVNCFVDYFSQSLRQEMFAKFIPVMDPRCGQLVHDQQGTASGNWFHSEAPPGGTNVEDQLALVRWNLDPDQIAIADGGALTGTPFLIVLPAATSGSTNRDPTDITNDGTIHCFDAPGGRLLVRLQSEVHLMVEMQSGDCGASRQFFAGQVYIR